MSDKRYGLRLDFPGAPPTDHVVPGLPGHFNTEVPTPVGEDYPISLERAKELAKEVDVLELVEVKNVREAEERAETALREGREGLVSAATHEAPGRVEAERQALKNKE